MANPPANTAFRVLWFGQFAAIAGLTIVVPLLPFYLAGLGVPAAAVPWWTAVALAAPAATQLVTAPLWGMVGDRYGHKAMVVRAHAGLAIAVGLMALADGPGEFLAYRLLQGACGGVVSATATYASSLAEPQRKGRALGGLFGATAAGSLLGPLVGSVLAGRFGFGLVFGCVAALLLAAAALALAVLPRAHSGPPSERGSRSGWPMRKVAARLLRERHSRTMLAAGLLGQSAIYALVVVFAPQVERITGSVASATVWVGALQAATWAASLLGSPWWGGRNDRRSAHVGFAIAATCCGVAVGLQALPTAPEMLLPLRFAQGFCFAALAQSVLHVACDVIPARARGATMGITSGLLDLGQLGGPVLGALAISLLPPPAAFAAIGILFVGAACLALSGARQRQADVPAAPTLIEVKS
jgi:MFS family permease